MGGEMESTKGADRAKNGGSANHDDSVEDAPGATRQDSWVDALVTILATIVFGLGWALVEFERADPLLNRYDATASEMWVAAVATSIEARAIEALAAGRRADEDARWTERALQNSNP